MLIHVSYKLICACVCCRCARWSTSSSRPNSLTCLTSLTCSCGSPCSHEPEISHLWPPSSGHYYHQLCQRNNWKCHCTFTALGDMCVFVCVILLHLSFNPVNLDHSGAETCSCDSHTVLQPDWLVWGLKNVLSLSTSLIVQLSIL